MNSFNDMLKKTKSDAPKKKAKTSVPEIQLPDSLKEDADAYKLAKKNKKIAEAEMTTRGGKLIDYGRKVQDKDGFNRDFRHSYTLKGDKEKVKYVSSNRFSINPDDARQIQEILGSAFPDLIEEDHTVMLRPEVFKDEGLQQRLMNAVGEDFADFFETVTKLKVKEDFDKNVFKHVEKKDLPILRTFVRPYKPSLR